MGKLPLLGFINFFSGLLPLGAGIYLWKRSDFSMRLLSGLLLFGFLNNLVQMIWALNNRNNMVFFHLQTLIAYLLVALLFANWHRGRTSHVIRWSILLFYASYGFLLGKGFENLQLPNKYSLSAMSVLVSIISLYTLYAVLRSHPEYSVYKDERFWVSLGVFFSFSSNALVYSGIPVYITDALWQIQNILVITGNLFYFIGYLCLLK